MSTEMGKSLIIKGLVPGLAEFGKIKIGSKGQMISSKTGKQFQPPKKLDYFRVTTLSRGPDDNFITDSRVHQLHGEQPKTLPVRLLYDQIDLNFQCRYVCFTGKTMWCAGDGEAAWRLTGQNGQRQQVDCPCGRQAPDYQGQDRCKINGALSVIIDGIDRVGGVWKLRTTSYNSVVGILSSLSLIKRITGGPLAGIPLTLTLNPKTVISPANGQTMMIWVVGLEYVGSIQALQDIGYKQALNDAKHYERIAHIEDEARKLIAHDPVRMDDEDPAEIAAEFYPEQFSKAADAPAPTPPTTVTITGPDEQNNAHAVDGDGDTPADDTGLTKQDVQSIPRRRRGNKYTVDPALFGGVTEISTCGSTPDQLLKLRECAKLPELRESIKQTMAAIGYQELSYLRADEAEQLLMHLQTTTIDVGEGPGPEPGAEIHAEEQTPLLADDLVQCPYDGEWRSKANHCMTHCATRKADTWCPAAGDEPPVGVNLFSGGAA
jgi:hypothetical protein